MRNWLQEPLLHFLVLGLGLFTLYGVVADGETDLQREIVVDQTQLAALISQHKRLWQRPPTQEELDGLIESWVRQEVLYREGLAAGLDRNDAIVRRRIVQKVTFAAEGMDADVPDDEAVQAWFREHADDYALDPSYTLRQVYFDRERHGDHLDDVMTSARAALEADAQAQVGDATLLPARLVLAPERELRRSFGASFAEALADAPDETWYGPVVSGYGAHLVRVDQRIPARMPPLSQVRKAVERDLMHARTKQAVESFYRSARERYRIRVEPPVERVAVGEPPVEPGS